MNLNKSEDLASDKNRNLMMMDFLNNLSNREKLIVTLFYYENLNYREISILLNLTVDRVSFLRRKIINRFKDLVKNISK